MTFRFVASSNPSNWPAWPTFHDQDKLAVARVIESNQLFADREVKHFEEGFSDFLDVPHSVAVGNATQGLHLALTALGVGEGHEVITTPYSWISSASCILMQNARPVFCDIEDEGFGLDPKLVEERINARTRAILVVHPFGYPARIAELAELAQNKGVALVEDASHAPGAVAGERRIGTVGDLSVFSFHQRKSLAVGDGGMVCTGNTDLAEKVARLRSFGDEELSYNYRMTEFAGAIGMARLGRLASENQLRIDIADYVAKSVSDLPHLSMVQPRTGDVGVYYAVLLRVEGRIPDLDAKLEAMRNLGIPIRKTWAPLHEHPHFNPKVKPARGFPGLEPHRDIRHVGTGRLDLPVTSSWIPDNLLELYIHPPCSEKHIDFAVERLSSLIES